ncbi:MAG TPA: hypothetical protein VFH45_10785, partial [Acidimicrobiales bacterium]|nr:hypothetical protein [Acidimicrobiales bacterium]
FESDTGNGQVLELVRSGSSFMSPAVNLTSKFTAPHFAPVGVATDGLGNLYVGDAETVPSGSGSGMVFESPLSGGVFQPAAVLPFGGAHFDPLGLAVDKAGNVYAADGEGGAFFGYTGHVLMLPNNGSSFGSQVALPFGGTHFFPYGVAVDGLNNVYASDLETQNGDGRVLEILATTAGHYAPQIALPYGGADFNPFQVAVNGQGEPFVGDLENGTAGRVLALPVNTASFISSGANPAGVGELTAFTTTVLPTSGLGNPTGTVAMSDTDGVLSCPSAALTPVGGGKPGSVASCTMSSPYTDSQRTNPATNPDTVSASYSGDLHYVPSTARYAEGIAQCIVGNRGSQVVVAAPACVGDPTNSVPTTLLAGLKTTGSGAAVNIQRIVDTGAITATNLVSSSGGNQVPSGYSFIMCNSQVNGPVSVSKAAGKVLIGDPNACGSNSLVGGLTLSNNTGGVTVGGNSLIFGGFSCSSNAPAPTNDGQKNNAFPGGSGQCAGL